MRARLLVLSALLLASAACGVGASGPPHLEVDRTSCSGCRMFVSETRFAAAFQRPGAEARVFDDIKCLLEAAAGEPEPLTFWFRDAAGDGWIAGADAVFVQSSALRTPMSGGIAAFRSRTAAAGAAAAAGARLFPSLADLRAAFGGGS